MYMLKLFLFTVLLRLPVVLLIGGGMFFSFKLLLKCRHHAITILAMLLISFAAITGLLYGSLRFGGVITFPSDNTMSWNWFDASWRDDGFDFIYLCGSALIGIVSAILLEWKTRRSRA